MSLRRMQGNGHRSTISYGSGFRHCLIGLIGEYLGKVMLDSARCESKSYRKAIFCQVFLLIMMFSLPFQQDVASANTQNKVFRQATSSEGNLREFGVLKIAKGVEETYSACTSCHSERVVAQQRMSRTHWEEVLNWMADEQGMEDIAEPTRSLILDYLSTHYNKNRPNFPDAKE